MIIWGASFATNAPSIWKVCRRVIVLHMLLFRVLLLSCAAERKLFVWGDGWCTVTEQQLRAWDCFWALWMKITCYCQCTCLGMLPAYKKTFFCLIWGKECACLKNNALSTRCKFRILLLECVVIQVLMDWAWRLRSLKTV